MKAIPGKQRGGSPVVTLVVLAVLAYGVFVAFGYVPQWLESKAVVQILDSMQESQASEPLTTQQAVETKVIRMLQINEMDDMVDAFKVTRSGRSFVVTFSYDRELNLGFETRKIHYENSVTL